MSISNYGERYLEHKQFLKLCADLEINTLSLGSDEKWLELLEKEKILFPICRIVYPKTYLKFINNTFDPSNFYNNINSISIPDRFRNIHTLKEAIKHFRVRRPLFHILDKRKSKFKKYIRYPNRSKYRQWKDYTTLVGQVYGHDNYVSRAKHYYSYWQVYYFYEITKACTLEYVINVFDEEINKELWNQQIPIKKIFKRNLPLKYSKNKGDFLGEANNFDALSFYVQTISQLGNFIFGSLVNIFDEKLNSQHLVFEKKVALIVIKKYDLNISILFNFLEFLCKKYYDFNRYKKSKLTEMIKLDIDKLISLIMDGYNLKYEDVNDKLGRVIPNFNNTLDVIFPKPFADERDNVMHTLPSSFSHSLNFNEAKNVTKDETESFLLFLEQNNLQLFYYSLGQININYSRNQSIFLHLSYLSLLLESIIKIIIKKTNNMEFEINLTSYSEMKKLLNSFFKSEGWRHSLSTHWTEYTVIDS